MKKRETHQSFICHVIIFQTHEPSIHLIQSMIREKERIVYSDVVYSKKVVSFILSCHVVLKSFAEYRMIRGSVAC